MNSAIKYVKYVVILFLCFLPSRARAWGCSGHEVVAVIAQSHLTPVARQNLIETLQQTPIDRKLRRYCNQKGLDLIASASTWADDYRSQHPETGPWHFIDIPRGAQKKDLKKYCPPQQGCITSAIAKQFDILRTGTAGKAKAEALRFVIHLVGDLHEPLHDTTNNDLGGNCVPVSFYDEMARLTNREQESYSPNLHNIWDSLILERAIGSQFVSQFAQGLDQRFQNQARAWQRAGIDVEEWAWEGHQLAETKAYGELPRKVTIEPPQGIFSCTGDNHIGSRMFALHETVAERYQTDVLPVIDRQLALAGVRLAMILNEVWR